MSQQINTDLSIKSVQRAGYIAMLDSKFVLVTSSKKAKFIFPKGKIKKYETAQLAAARESYEEGGIIGTVTKSIGVINGVQWFFAIIKELTPEYPEKNSRSRILMTEEELLEHSNVSKWVKEIVLFLKNAENIY